MSDNVYQSPQSTVIDDSVMAETQPVKIFNPSGRMGRARYTMWLVSFPILLLVILLMFFFFAGVLSASEVNEANSPLWIVFVGLIVLLAIGSLVLGFLAAIQRCHDFGVSGWLSLIILLSPLHLIFCFIPGNKGPNEYGPKPEPNTTGVWILALLGPVLLVLFYTSGYLR